MPYHEYEIDDEAGSGSRSALEDTKTGDIWETKDQRAETRTMYTERDIDKHCTDPRYAAHLRRALRFQEGEHVNATGHKSRGQQNHEEDKRRLVSIYSSQLNLTDAQKERVEHLTMDVVDINSFGHYSMEQVILTVINVVTREDGRWIEDEDRFREFMERVGITNSSGVADLNKMHRLRALAKERIPSRS